MTAAPTASVCITTFRRAHVAETIASVQRQVGVDPETIEIVVCDDAPEGGAAAQLAPMAAADARIRLIASGAGNVAAARNACLSAGRGRFILFLDDDEIAHPDWVAQLLRTQSAHQADVVKGAVHGVYPPETPPWIRRADPYSRDYGPTGAPLRRAASGNVLIRRDLVEAHQVRFDPAFGRSGGEDTDFFDRLKRASPKMVACREAIVDEITPPERATPAYLARRYRRYGQTDGRKAMRDGAAQKKRTEAVIGRLAVITAPLAPALPAKLRFQLFAKRWYAQGLLEGLSGRADLEMD
jgi:succinoglycan biosynthesis protein ExoM